jgi:hypothetical protein
MQKLVPFMTINDLIIFFHSRDIARITSIEGFGETLYITDSELQNVFIFQNDVLVQTISLRSRVSELSELFVLGE